MNFHVFYTKLLEKLKAFLVIPHFKISIKTYLFVLPFVVLIFILFTILGVNYYVQKQQAKTIASKLLSQSTLNVYDDFNHLISQVDQTLAVTKNIIENQILTPKNRKETDAYLFHILKINPVLKSASLTDSRGDFYLAHKIRTKQFVTLSFVKNAEKKDQVKITLTQLNGKSATYLGDNLLNFNPHLQQWYKSAQAEKNTILANSNKNRMNLLWFPNKNALTDSLKIHTKAPKLDYVFALDLDLHAIEKIFRQDKYGQSTVAFLINQNGQIKRLHISQDLQKTAQFSLYDKANSDHNDLLLPWAEYSRKIYAKNKQPLFLYNFLGNQYIATYTDILKNHATGSWKLVVVRPLSYASIFSSYHTVLFNSVIILSFMLAAALMLFIFIQIIRPIRQLDLIIHHLEKLEFKQARTKAGEKALIKELSGLGKLVDFVERGIESFARYVPMPVVRQIMQSGSIANVSGESCQITTLFSDIKGFTTISEGMQPRELMLYLSEYFENMTNVILSKRGTLDKYIGDGIMAFWGAPFDDKNHALHACQCALMLNEAVARMNKVFMRKNLPILSLRIGISTGYAVVGNVGSKYRLNYTAMGDSVNLGSRLEALGKLYKTKILIDENTYKAVSDQFKFRLVDLVAVKGKKHSAYVYELLNRHIDMSREELKKYNKAFRLAFNLYRVADWSKALEHFNQLLKNHPDDSLIKLYIQRCELFSDLPPIHWDGVFDARKFNITLGNSSCRLNNTQKESVIKKESKPVDDLNTAAAIVQNINHHQKEEIKS